MSHPQPAFLPVRILCALALTVTIAQAQDWSDVPIIQHRTYQAVISDGSSAYTPPEPFEIRLRGVVLNDNEDWLNPTANYLPYDGGANASKLGGQAEIFVQAVNLDGTDWDPDPGNDYDDFGGTAAWMGQNYGNLPWIGDVDRSYQDLQWYGELDRLGLLRPNTSVEPLIRAGDLVEIRARGGLHYAGKMNVNEQHNNDSSFDFELKLLQKGYGMPEATPLSLAELLDPGFDSSRQTGGEHYQSTLVTLQDVSFVDGSWDPAERQLTVTDGQGREIDVEFGWNVSLPELSTPTDLTGILNQDAGNGQGGYYLVVVPEPGAIVLLGLALVLGLGRRRRR